MKTILIFLIIFSVIVVIHEFGHYYFAKRSGIRVREFSIGMGPKLFAKQGSDLTTYTLRILPLGGYVRLAGLNEEDGIEPGMELGLMIDDNQVVQRINHSTQTDINELPVRVNAVDLIDEMEMQVLPAGKTDMVTYKVSKDAVIIEPDSTVVPVAPREMRYESATPFEKIKTNIAGPLMNFILSIVVYTIIAFMLPGVPVNTPEAYVGQVVEDSPADQAGIEAGDTIVSIDGESTETWVDFSEIVANQPNQTVEMTVARGDKMFTTDVTIGSTENQETGQEMGQVGVVKGSHYDSSLSGRLTYGFRQTWAVVTGVLSVIAGMFRTGFNIDNFGGPIAIAQLTNQVVEYGLIPILSFTAYISANLGIFNLLPIPALDGGKIVLNIIEALRGKPLDQSKEGIITLIGVLLLLVLMLFVTWNDIVRVFF